MRRLSGQTVIVTGGSAGIGLSIGRHLAGQGAIVVIADLNRPAGDIGARNAAISYLPVDVTDQRSVDELMAQASSRFGHVDVLVNNAGIFGELIPRPFTELELDEWRRIFEVNVLGVFNCCRSVLAVMPERGRIINIASAAALKGLPMLLHYVSSKGAVLAMTRALARELAGRDIRVNSVCPGFTLSESVRENPEMLRELRESAVQTRLLKRDQVPADITGVVGFLAGPYAEFITGQTFVVDGGSVLH